MDKNSKVIETTKSYYDSSDADEFYYHIWGGEDIHIGIYDNEGMTISEASQKTIVKMVKMLKLFPDKPIILDLGSGYGGAARYLAKNHNARVHCLNLSVTENQRNRQLNKEQNLDSMIDVVDGNFEDIPFSNDMFDIVWSEDAILHSPNKLTVFQQTYKTLKDSGQFIFTDPMQKHNISKNQLQPVLDRIHLDSLGSFEYYQELSKKVGFKTENIVDLSIHLVNHYKTVKNKLTSDYDKMESKCSKQYLDRMILGLEHWIKAGQENLLTWGILHFSKNL